jgi:hypothetical protein
MTDGLPPPAAPRFRVAARLAVARPRRRWIAAYVDDPAAKAAAFAQAAPPPVTVGNAN